MLDFGFYNMDCMEGMKDFPDDYFELAIVDPPYGDAGGGWTNGERFGQRFDRYRHNSEGGVARQAEVQAAADTLSADCGKVSVHRTGGTWAEKFGKKSYRGTLPPDRTISMNCFASHVTRLSGGGTTLTYRRRDVF